MNKKDVAQMLILDELIRADKMQAVAKIFENKETEKQWFLVEHRMIVLYRKMEQAYKMNEKGKTEEEILKRMNELEIKFLKDDFGIGL